MFGFGKSKKKQGAGNTPESAGGTVAPEQITEQEINELGIETPEPLPSGAVALTEKESAEDKSQGAAESESKKGFFQRIKKGLGKTRSGFATGLGNLLLGEKEIDDEVMEEIEMLLVMADVGVDATRTIIDTLGQKVGRRELTSSRALYKALQEELYGLLAPVEVPLEIDESKSPYVILMVGVNGVGKTTTIGKLAKRFKAEGKSVMLAAGDTFRAAAVEQLQVWGERNDVAVVAQSTGSDSASVIFDALQAAKARGVDVLIADTAGRLHTKTNLMDELSKVTRVMAKLDQEAPHEVMLVIDAGTGQNALNQVKSFDETTGVTGITLTKLDGTAKGGIIFALANQFKIPIRFIGVGEQVDDMRPFEAREFVDALFSESD
ncbi:MAG: signal recognition particle-docking protein FtsY [Gammaproteobacteria bacterium]|nr:signal recognition particle-docking protein FtsY [Gammaproteobacteria bacterium]